MAANDRSIRASDADRERVAASLRDHYAAGRLNSDEFNERLDKTYAATTLGQLDDLQTDLPVPQVPEPIQLPGPVAAVPGQFPLEWRRAAGSWLSVSLVCFVIWLLSGASGSLWFLWPSGILGALLLARLLTGAPPARDRALARRQYRRDYRRNRRGF